MTDAELSGEWSSFVRVSVLALPFVWMRHRV